MGDSPDERVLVLAPGRDGALTCQILAEAGIACHAVGSVAAFGAELDRGAAAAVFAEEVLDQASAPLVAAALQQQPAWSDLPVIVVVREGGNGSRLRAFAPLGNVSILARPMNLGALTTAVESARRARRR